MEKQIILQNKVSEISKLTVFVEEIGKILSLDYEGIFNINLALEEIFTNIVLYAYPNNEYHLIDIHFRLLEDKLEFEFIDSGIPFDPTSVSDADVSLPAEKRGMGGLGIFIVKKMMDKVCYQRVGKHNILTLVKYL